MDDFINEINFIYFNIIFLIYCLGKLFPENRKWVFAMKLCAMLFCIKFGISVAYPLVLLVSCLFFGKWCVYPIFFVLVFIILSWQKSRIFFMNEDQRSPEPRPCGKPKVDQKGFAPRSEETRSCLQPQVTTLAGSNRTGIPGLNFGRELSWLQERQELLSMSKFFYGYLQPHETALRIIDGIVGKEVDEAGHSLLSSRPQLDSEHQSQIGQQMLFNREPLGEIPVIDISGSFDTERLEEIPVIGNSSSSATVSPPRAMLASVRRKRRKPKAVDFHRPMPRKRKPTA